ncbi:MAG: ABC transporter permease [Deltaproteobacteria bacterium]|nr:ABC transporter permease [Deltaproteobacteria bacterium]
MHVDRGQLRRDPWFLIGLGLATVFGLLALLGPPLAPFDPWDMRFAPISPPTGHHWLGVNDGGQDILSELLFAVRNTVAFGLLSGMTSLVLGIVAGLASGWYGGVLDAFLMRLSDVLLAVPAIMILILTAALFRPDPWVLALILSGLMWPTVAKTIRAQTLGLKGRLHVRAAVQMGGGGGYVLRRHLLPEMFPLYLIGFSAKARMAMFMEASLAFLGLFDPSRKSLGMMINYALQFYYLDVWWHWLLPPVLCLSFLIMAVTFLAVALEKVMDPRLRASAEVGP